VEECFVLCCAHANQITSHLTKSKWRSQPNFVVTPIESHVCVSAGDAVRLVKQRDVRTMFFNDYSGNAIDFKAMTTPSNLFAKYTVE